MNTGEGFQIVDNWTHPENAHRMLKGMWIGTTVYKEVVDFVVKGLSISSVHRVESTTGKPRSSKCVDFIWIYSQYCRDVTTHNPQLPRVQLPTFVYQHHHEFHVQGCEFHQKSCSRSKETSPSFVSPQQLVEYQQQYHSVESSYDYSFDGDNLVTRGALLEPCVWDSAWRDF